MVKEGRGEGLRVLGKYELGRTLGQGNFGKVKYAKHVETGQAFAVKILDRSRVQSLNFSDQVSSCCCCCCCPPPLSEEEEEEEELTWSLPFDDRNLAVLCQKLCTRLSGDLGVCKSQQHICKALSMPELSSFGGDVPVSAASTDADFAVRFKSRDGRRTRERDSELELEIMAAATYPSSARLRPVNHLATRHLNSHPLVSKPKLLISVSRAAPLQTRFRGARLPSLLPVIRAQSSPGFAANGYSRSYSVRRSRFWGTRRLNREAWCSDMCK
ncbi:hypothetical protein BHM03_00050883 [Ensete ventricosum]|nr:hypothetical protein BHM03_00050883 [Ensete ventricosum]